MWEELEATMVMEQAKIALAIHELAQPRVWIENYTQRKIPTPGLPEWGPYTP